MAWYSVVWLAVQAVAVVASIGLVVETRRDTLALRRVGAINGRKRVARRNARRAWARLTASGVFAAGGVLADPPWHVGDTPVLAAALIFGALLLTADAVEDWLVMRHWGDR